LQLQVHSYEDAQSGFLYGEIIIHWDVLRHSGELTYEARILCWTRPVRGARSTVTH
jgi:hypothetical protein